MQPDSSKRHAGSILLIGLSLSLVFFVILIILLNHGGSASPPADGDASAYPQDILGEYNIPDVIRYFFSIHSLYCYEVIIAGMIGSFLQEVSGTNIGQNGSDSRRLLLSLFFGAALAVVGGILLPQAIGRPNAGPYFHSWTLVLIGGFAGAQSRRFFGGTEATLAKLLEKYSAPIDAQEISKAVTTEIKDAFALPQAVNYEGYVNVDIVKIGHSIISDGKATLTLGTEYKVNISFNENSEHGSAAGKLLRISGGVDDSLVPLRLVVDFGFVRLPPQEREIEIPRYGPANVVVPFVTPVVNKTETINGLTEDETKIEILESAQQQKEVSVIIYQHSRFVEIQAIPFEVST
ncbi:hypothetical protein [Rhizobium leguminosarum]|uniref:hypothetical protein n=1 Tax=Rhizobium leguminosarum TaxID=384 RepID=UPI0024A86AC9|nr:hypothetical protein [Rhizobium leguminosarum]MDI5929028.1 hypothetical protein [Rhizobium leguminosarum]